ncbi:unnamed protein product, partial [Prorocentrum cordatum]
VHATEIIFEQFLGGKDFKHVAAVDTDPDSQRFITLNFAPAHYFRRIGLLGCDKAQYSTKLAGCQQCGDEPCGSYDDMMNCDMMICGFPCPPFSALNAAVHDRGYRFWQHPQGGVIVDLAWWVNVTMNGVGPKIIILEQVPGIKNTNKSSGHAPLKYILEGVAFNYKRNVADDAIDFKYGLKHWKEYVLVKDADLDYIVVNACSMGLPILRTRLFFILIRKDFYEDSIGVNIRDMLNIAQMHPLRQMKLQDFVEETPPLQATKRRRSTAKPMSDVAAKQSNEYRATFNLPHLSDGIQSKIAVADGELPAREADIVNVLG